MNNHKEIDAEIEVLKKERMGAQNMGLTNLVKRVDEKIAALTAAKSERKRSGKPVHSTGKKASRKNGTTRTRTK